MKQSILQANCEITLTLTSYYYHNYRIHYEVTMSIQAIISEYNPFHNGHLYQINKAKEITNADYTLALMGGNFLQRGEAAMWDKYTRSKMAITSGVDLVLELPFPYATGSAHDFATGAINILNSLNCIDYICFGAEESNLVLLDSLAEIIFNEPVSFSESFKNYLSSGLSYPAAREKALIEYTKNDNLTRVLSQPNNTLAIEYLVALKTTNSNIKPILIERTNNYHEKKLDQEVSSASAIRQAILADNQDISNNVPISTMSIIKEAKNNISPIKSDLLTPFIQERLILENSFINICDITEELNNKLIKLQPNLSYNEIISYIKSKDITEARIKRCLIHLLLNYTDELRKLFVNDNFAYYANILGFKKSSSGLIKYINASTAIPLITKKADAKELICNAYPDNSKNALLMWQLDTKATALYTCLVKNKYNNNMPNDYTVQLPIV